LLDDLAVEDCRAFEAELYKFLDDTRPAVLNSIREKKAFDKQLESDLTGAINELKEKFKKERGRPAAAAGAKA
jgi:F-type H+-transporting ATPase subunit alpha